MAEYAISTNLISWVPAKRGLFGWPADGPEAEVVEAMRPGDLLIPKFAQSPHYGSQAGYVRGICARIGLDYEEELADYEAHVAGGLGAVPFLWEVVRSLPPGNEFPSDAPWSLVEIAETRYPVPFSTSEFLRLRAIPIEIARQFKAMAAPGRRIQKVPPGTADRLLEWGREERDDLALRKLMLVKGGDTGSVRAMERNGLALRDGDYLFLAQDGWMPGFHMVRREGSALRLVREGEQVPQSAEELTDLFRRAAERALPSDEFRPRNPVRAARVLTEFLASGEPVLPVEEFRTFYDLFAILPQKVSQALEIAERPPPSASAPGLDEVEDDLEGDEEESEDSERLEEDRRHGLTVAAVQEHLDGIVLPRSVLAEAVTAIRAGKHVLLSGPPGTGKSVVAAALCRAVVGKEFKTATATADWTTFDTIGGYIPQANGGLEFEPGIVLRCLESGRWLIIDELNRADIDKAFGPLFTLFSSSGEEDGNEDVTLPFRKAEKSIRIVWSRWRATAPSPYALTPNWRMIGTLNVRDKASLFQLSFAFMRRFAVVDVPLPAEAGYRQLFEGWVQKVDDEPRAEMVEAAMRLAFGKRPLGPAILKDIAGFVSIGLAATETASASSLYGDPVEAFLTAVRLYAAPQYEGSPPEEIEDLLRRLRGVWQDPPESAWAALERALTDVGLGELP